MASVQEICWEVKKTHLLLFFVEKLLQEPIWTGKELMLTLLDVDEVMVDFKSQKTDVSEIKKVLSELDCETSYNDKELLQELDSL